MDKSSLINTVIITVVTLSVRWLVSAIASWLKTATISAIHSPDAKLMCSKQGLMFMFDSVVIIGIYLFVRFKFSGQVLATHEDLFNLFVYCVLMFFFMGVAAMDGYLLRKFYAEQAKKAQEQVMENMEGKIK